MIAHHVGPVPGLAAPVLAHHDPLDLAPLGTAAAHAVVTPSADVPHIEPGRAEVLRKINARCSDNGVQTQLTKCLTALQLLGSLSTLEARRCLDVLHPAARIKELNDAGLVCTVTLRKAEETECGRVHRVGLYVVVRGTRP